MLKTAYLQNEIEEIKKILIENDLVLDKYIDKTFYIEENGIIIGTISVYKNIIKDIAVKEQFLHLGYFDKLISEMINYLYQNNIYHILVFTKTKYACNFMNVNFHLIVETDKVAFLEYGPITILDKIKQYRRLIEDKFDINVDNEDIASLVINANPLTNGHMYLIEKASKEHKYVIVFVLEEDLSFFTYKERLSMVYLACMSLTNVIVVPSSEYIISTATFPGYFLKENTNEKQEEWAKVDVLIFKEYFMKELNITSRYIGEESKEYMIKYNNLLKEYLENKCLEVPRYENISASVIREKIKEGDLSSIINDIPQSIRSIFIGIVNGKN